MGVVGTQAQRLGLVVFQFHLSFRPSPANRDHVLECRRRLYGPVGMAVEFRNREWFHGAPPLPASRPVDGCVCAQ